MAKKKNSVQKLIGFDAFTKFGVRTDKCAFAFFVVEPTNISVLSAANIEAKVHHLTMLLSMIPELEILALDSCECFDTNKNYVRKRLEHETNESVRKLLQADYEYLDEIQLELSSARQFLFCIRFRKETDEQIATIINRCDKMISEHGFLAKRMKKADIKRMFGLYFGTGTEGDSIADTEGAEYFRMEDAYA